MAGPYHSTDPSNRNVIDGTDGNDILVGTSKDDAIYGHDGNDYLYGVSGFDTLYGGKGDDVYVTYSDSLFLPQIIENLGEGNDTLLAYGGTYVPDNIENARAMGDYPVTLLGNALDNLLIGNAASNYIDGGAGVDTMIGGAGDDTYTVNTPGDRIVEAADGGYDTVRLFNVFFYNDPSVSTYQMPANVEKAVSVSYGVNIVGNDLDNVISGHGYLDGGAGADTLIGYVGRDIFVVDNQNDTVTANDHVDIVLAKADYTLSKDADPAYLSAYDIAGTTPLHLTGNCLANTIYGNAGNDILDGSSGNDTLVGNGGFDRLYGGTGDDIFVVTTGNDVIEGANGGTDHVLTEQDFALTTGQEIEWLQARHQDSTAGLTLIGNEFGNHIVGAAGDDVLAGKEGDDTLAGLGGVDLLKGGTGADRFVFRDGDTGTTAATADTIADFSHAQGDRIDLSQIDANTGIAGDQAFTLHASGDDHVAGALWLTQSGNDALVNMDTNGDGQADYLLHLADLKAASLVAADFVF